MEDGARAYLSVKHWKEDQFENWVEDDLRFHSNRYAYFGPTLRMLPVFFGWSGVAFADIRDLNRHRTGSKECSLYPRGFYGARDQSVDSTLDSLLATGRNLTQLAKNHAEEAGPPIFVYWILLGTQFSFEHTTTADKFIYEAELRTGLGAHYRYAKHLHDVLALWYEKFPETKGLILEGQAEPE